MEKININDFVKLDLRVGKILEVQEHPNADKLFVLTVDLGEEKPRTICAGLQGHYEAEQLQGMEAIFIANLEPRELRGVESNGMILAASNEDKSKVVILVPENGIKAGSKIS